MEEKKTEQYTFGPEEKEILEKVEQIWANYRHNNFKL